MLPTQRLPALAQKQALRITAPGQSWPCVAQIAFQPVLRFIADRHQPLFIAFAVNPQYALTQVHTQRRQSNQLTYPQAGGIHQLNHGAHAQPGRVIVIRSGEQRLDLAFRQRLGQ